MTKENKKRIKSILKEWGNDTAAIYAKKREMDRLSSVSLNLENKGSNVILLNSIEDRVSAINRGVINRLGIKRELDSIIDRLTYEEQSIIRLRYVEKTSWEHMPLKMPVYISLRQCYRLHERAIEFIYDSLISQQEYGA